MKRLCEPENVGPYAHVRIARHPVSHRILRHPCRGTPPAISSPPPPPRTEGSGYWGETRSEASCSSRVFRHALCHPPPPLAGLASAGVLCAFFCFSRTKAISVGLPIGAQCVCVCVCVGVCVCVC